MLRAGHRPADNSARVSASRNTPASRSRLLETSNECFRYLANRSARVARAENLRAPFGGAQSEMGRNDAQRVAVAVQEHIERTTRIALSEGEIDARGFLHRIAREQAIAVFAGAAQAGREQLGEVDGVAAEQGQLAEPHDRDHPEQVVIAVDEPEGAGRRRHRQQE